jgi:DNA-binding CsgD family transcriptional regulator
LASLQGRIEAAEAQLAELAATVRSDSQRGLVAITRLDNYVFYRGRIAEGLAVAEQAEAAIADPAWRDEVTAHRSTITLAVRGPRAAVEAVEPLLDRATGRTLVWACLVGSFALSRLGRLDAALAAAAKGEAGRQSLTRPLEWYPSFHVFARCEALAHAGRLDEVQALATAEHEQGLALGSAETQALFAWQLAKTVGDRGDVGGAARHAREAAVLFRELGRPQFERECLVYLALALALAGRAGDADHVLGRLATAAGPPALFTAGVDLLIARAWAAVAGADLPTARSLLIEAADLGEEIGDLVAAATALHGLARLPSPSIGPAARRLVALAPQIEGDLAPARARHAVALAGSDPDALMTESQAFEGMGAHLLAADAAAAAVVIWATAGDARSAAGARHRTGSLVARCEGAVTPALLALGEPERLTPSEREAALLAAAGRSNRDIADRLYLSVRTVENRLQRVYEKLGVSSRRELADALGIDPSGGST